MKSIYRKKSLKYLSISIKTFKNFKKKIYLSNLLII